MPHQQLGLLPSIAISIAMLAIGALVWGGLVLALKRGQKLKGTLMVVCALVVLGNVLILTV
jgi:hypothetical protein